jgi:hypothetical protein
MAVFPEIWGGRLVFFAQKKVGKNPGKKGKWVPPIF